MEARGWILLLPLTALSDPGAPALSLASSRLEPAPARGERFELHARLAPVSDEAQLRGAGRFEVLGRFAKAGASCAPGALFRDGFEN